MRKSSCIKTFFYTLLLATLTSQCLADSRDEQAIDVIRKATQAVKLGAPSTAMLLYAPVLKRLSTKELDAGEPLVNDLERLSNELEIKKCIFEACAVETTIWSVRRGQLPPFEIDRSILDRLARLHYNLRNYDSAAPEYLKLLELNKPTENPEWCQNLVRIYCEKNERDKLTALMPMLASQIEAVDLKTSSQNFIQIIVMYLSVGLDIESDQLFRILIKAMQKSNLPIVEQTLVLDSIGTECAENNQLDFATDLYKYWTDAVKSKYGANSGQWLESMNYWLGFCNSYNINGAKSATSDQNPGGAENSLRTKTSKSPSVKVGLKFEGAQSELVRSALRPSSCTQRLAMIHVLQNLLPTERDLVIKKLEAVLQDMPQSLDTAQVYVTAAGLYYQLGYPKRDVELQRLALVAIAKWLPKNTLWIKQYIEKLEPTLTAEKSIEPLIDRLTTQIKSPKQDYQPLELSVISELEMHEQPHAAMNALKILIAKQSLGKASQRDITTLWKCYESQESILERLPIPTRNISPNLDLVAQYACILLEPSLQRMVNDKPWQDLENFEFIIRDYKVTSVVHPNYTTSVNDENIIQVISKLAKMLPENREFHFRLSVNANTKKATLSFMRQNGVWKTPNYAISP